MKENRRNYDSTAETLNHIKRVNELLLLAAKELMDRAVKHDASKLMAPEKECFDSITPRMKEVTYGSPEYREIMAEFKPVIDHHQISNSQHPEFYENGINDFDLFDLMELFFDWKAASERHADGDLLKSIQINKERFGYSDQLAGIMENTANRYLNKDKPCSRCGGTVATSNGVTSTLTTRPCPLCLGTGKRIKRADLEAEEVRLRKERPSP